MKNYNVIIYLIGLDILTTTICILLGGIEYNPISMFVMKQSYILFIIVKCIFMYMFYLLGRKTNIFNELYGKIFLYPSIIIFLCIVLLNGLYIFLKITGLI